MAFERFAKRIIFKKDYKDTKVKALKKYLKKVLH